jgi:uncharacterized repeat protein (TIGR01451 family)
VNTDQNSRSTASTVSKEIDSVTSFHRSHIASFISKALCAAATLALAGMGMLLIASPASAAAPAWSLQSSKSPHNFHAGKTGSYTLTITNAGDAASAGPIHLTDTLPPILTYAGVKSGPSFSCTGDGSVGDPLDCVRTAPLSPDESDSVQLSVGVGMPLSGDSETVTNTATVSGGGAAADASVGDPTLILGPYSIKSFTSRVTDEAEADYTLAGGHPFQNQTAFEFYPSENLKDASVTIEPGFIGNPATAARCPVANIGDPILITTSVTTCPPGSRVGTAIPHLFVGVQARPLYNLVPERGYSAQFGFRVGQTVTILDVVPLPRSESYGLTVGTHNVPNGVGFSAFATTFCSYGAPESSEGAPCNAPSGSAQAPFLSNPIDCSEAQPTWKVVADSWENPGPYTTDTYTEGGFPDLASPAWLTASVTAPPVTGCGDPLLASQFNSTTITTKPLQPGGGPVQADAPSGLSIAFKFPQSNNPIDPDTEFDNSTPQAPEPKTITTTLPAGLSVSPSSADGLAACSDLASDPAGDQVHYDNTKPVRCPDAAKIGSATALTPLLAAHDPVDDHIVGPEPIPGDVYLLKPHPGDLPIGGGRQEGKFRLLIQLENANAGVNIKLPGVATADPNTGQLSATFTESPQLPSSQVQVNLKTGPRASLASPTSCGSFTTTTNLVPWGTPEVPNATPSSTFNVSSGPGGSPCPLSPATRPFAPTISAGMDSNAAGKYSPFVLHLNRADGEQELSTIDVTTPKGFSAKLAGVPNCPEAAIASAATKSGASEQSSPSCPAASQVGTVVAGAGPGPTPYYASGKAYLAGPYKGAPLSFVFITPAVAGPFDLGTVVVRAAAFVDPETAQVMTKTDPLPQIIDGVPLKLRSVTARLDRPNFTINPTNCQAMNVSAAIGSSNGALANPSNPFQVDGCKGLGFKPKLKIDLKGDTKRGSFPALKATLAYPSGAYANIAKAQVTLPHSEFLEQGHIKTICTRVQFAANACPAASIYGKATATTPLLDAPLSGPVYLRSSSNKLPDLVADLNGQIHVALAGRIDSIKGGIRTTFEGVPDAPVSKFTLEMLGGKKGLLVNSTNICNSDNRAIVALDAQNGLSYDTKPALSNDCKKSNGAKGKKAHKRNARR